VFPFFLVLLYLADRGYLRALQERDTWRVLQDASADLIRVDEDGLAAVVLDRAASLFGAEFAELMLVDGEPGSYARVFRWTGDAPPLRLEGHPMELAGSFWPRAFSEREPFEVVAGRAPAPQRRELEQLGLAVFVVAPLPARDRCLGTLRIGFRGVVRMDARERQVLATFANHVTSCVGNARLFQEMNEERAKLSRVFSTSSDGILSIDGTGCVTSWNPAMARMTGVATAAAVGAPLFNGGAVLDEDGVRLSVEALLLRLRHEDQLELAVEVRGGGARWLHLSVAAVRTAAGETDLAVVVARDVTARRELEEAKQDFIATVSHELRTPLTPLKGFLHTLLRPGYKVGEDELRVHLSRMLHNAERLERLIEDLLSVSQIDQDVMSVCSVAVNVDDAVEKAVAGLSAPVEHRRAGLVGTALADPDRVEQVVANLVGNADKYAPGSPVVVTVTRDRDRVVVQVRDEGPGIPEDQQEAIFERFHRLGHHLTRTAGGTGLGLYIARHLVEAMGGRIWVESRPGHGATFTFTLPAAPLVATLDGAADLRPLRTAPGP
jgi:PAS domain S-box-containing protein